jgi:hypothetical protein
MARGTTLGQLINKLRGELGQTLSPAQGQNTLETYKLRLARIQEKYYHDYDWPFLMGPYDVEMQTDGRYYDLPVQLETISKAEVYWGNTWRELPYGIGAAELNSTNSDIGETLDPPCKWQLRIDPTDTDLTDNQQFEVWPIPSTNYSDNGAKVRFWGKRALTPLTSNTHKCLLDDNLIVLFAAATLLKDKADRQIKLAEAKDWYDRLKGRNRKKKMFILGGEGGCSKPPEPSKVFIAYPANT